MKANIKHRILDAIASIEECHRCVAEASTLQQFVELLGLCQELAVSVGTTLESYETKVDVTPIVSMLEKYCEEIYHFSSISSLHSEDFTKKLSDCNTDISHIKHAVTNDIPTEKLVAVFLPYMASMWDCLDSICREAMKSEEWDIYVMPIPYYGRDSAGRAVTTSFEFDKFSSDLPLVNYESCPLAELAPDLIFYHNPYDDHNRVTCVHPQFFSRNLLEITPHIVYVPYYLSGEKTMEHMPLMPGVKNAWKVVVQKEIKAQYLIHYTDDKIVALGSPKLDALFSANTQDIPTEWKLKIENKTVIFLNTHLTSVMLEPEKYIDMLDYTMDEMKNNEDIVILWRPHPLMEQTLTSFEKDSSILKKYHERIQRFKLLPNGIYDDTANLNLSIAISDAYLGSQRSSVIRMYRQLEKPICILPDVFENPRPETKCFRANLGGVVLDGYIWQFDSLYNALFKMSLETHEISYVFSLEEYPYVEQHLYYTFASYNDWLILLPGKRKDMALFHTKTHEVKYIQLEDSDFEEIQFFSMSVKENTATIVTCGMSEYYYTLCLENFTCKKEYINHPGRLLCVSEEHILMHHDSTNQLILHNTFDKTSKKCTTSHVTHWKLLPYVFIDGDCMWVVCRDEGVLLYWENIHAFNEYSTHDIYPACKNNNDLFIRMCYVQNSQLIFSILNSEEIFCYSVKTKTKQHIYKKTIGARAPYSLDAIKVDDTFYILPFLTEDARILKIHESDNTVSEFSFALRDMALLQEIFIKKDILNTEHRLSRFLPYDFFVWAKAVKHKKTTVQHPLLANRSLIGSKIWDYFKDIL